MAEDGSKEIGSKTIKDWRALATEAASETDPEKLNELVEALCAALDERQKPAEEQPRQDSARLA